jgi:hypothetical protein
MWFVKGQNGACSQQPYRLLSFAYVNSNSVTVRRVPTLARCERLGSIVHDRLLNDPAQLEFK